LLPEGSDSRRVEIDADEATGCQHFLTFEHVEGQEASLAHQFAPVTAELGSAAVFPEQKGGFAQDAEVAFPAGHFGGIVKGIVLAIGEVNHGLDSMGG